ncbi:hypothetical protein PGB90_008768 [Kerria lacca]
MNSFSSGFIFPQIEEFTIPLQNYKSKEYDSYQKNFFRNNSETVTRKSNSKEMEFESKNDRYQIQEQESAGRKFTNISHIVDVSCKTIDREELVCHRKETLETKIFIIEKRPIAIPTKFALIVWKQLKRLVGVKHNINFIEAGDTTPTTDTIDENFVDVIEDNIKKGDAVVPLESGPKRNSENRKKKKILFMRIIPRKKDPHLSAKITEFQSENRISEVDKTKENELAKATNYSINDDSLMKKFFFFKTHSNKKKKKIGD